MKSAQGEKSKYGTPVITFCHKTWQEPFIASAGGTLLQTNHDLLWRKKIESWTRVNEIPLVNLGSLFFWTVVFWENIRSLKHRQQHTEILHLELCFWHQSLLTGDKGLLAPKDPPVIYMGWLGWSQPSVHTKKNLYYHTLDANHKAHQHFWLWSREYAKPWQSIFSLLPD